MFDINFAQLFIALIVLLFSLTVHESAHAWMANRLGDPTSRLQGRLSLNPIVHADLFGTLICPLVAGLAGAPLIGWAKPVPVDARRFRRERRDFALVALAGPAANVALAVLASLVLSMMTIAPMRLGEPNVSAPLASILSQAMRLNLLLAVFNLLPIPPLDGGQVVSRLLPDALSVRVELLRPLGVAVLYVLVMTHGVDHLVAPPTRVLLSWLQ